MESRALPVRVPFEPAAVTSDQVVIGRCSNCSAALSLGGRHADPTWIATIAEMARATLPADTATTPWSDDVLARQHAIALAGDVHHARKVLESHGYIVQAPPA